MIDTLKGGPDYSRRSFKIRLTYVYPPIPYRGSDWLATLDGWEPGEPSGEGSTIMAALGELMSEIEERKCNCNGGAVHQDACRWERWNRKGLESDVSAPKAPRVKEV